MIETEPLPTLAEAQPACLAEWDSELNEAEGFYHDVVTLGSNKLVHWICSCRPRGQPHRWTASPAICIGKGTGCAVCAGRQACTCNSLESLLPSIAAEVDVDKTGFALSEVTAKSHGRVWWRNAKRGSWMQSVNLRTPIPCRTSRTDCTHQVLLLLCCAVPCHVVLCCTVLHCGALCCAMYHSHSFKHIHFSKRAVACV